MTVHITYRINISSDSFSANDVVFGETLRAVTEISESSSSEYLDIMHNTDNRGRRLFSLAIEDVLNIQIDKDY